MDAYDILNNMFQEPEPEPEKPTFTTFKRNSTDAQSGPLELKISLPPKHSLWAHCLWNAGRCMAYYLDKHKEIYVGKNVLELGAAAALPSLICSINGAKRVVSTDYPDNVLIENIILNAKTNVPEFYESNALVVKGYLWGKDEKELEEPLTINGKFDLIILADLIFNHSQHANMLKSCKAMLLNTGYALMMYSHHIPKKADKDMEFFKVAEEMGFTCEKLFEQRFDPMFPEDPGDVNVRSTVFAWKIVYTGSSE